MRASRRSGLIWPRAGLLVLFGLILALALAPGVTGRGKVSNGSGPHPLPAKRPPGWIAIEKVSDGCGQEGSVFRAHDQTYETDSGQEITVDFTEACNVHDAAYSGAFVWDSINGKFVDFSDPYWTKATIDEKFKHDLQRLCFRAFPDAAGMGAEKALYTCLTSNDVRKGGTWGALSFYDIVTSIFGASPRERIDLTGQWKNTAPGWPLCDIGAHPWSITQSGREVKAEWKHGTAGEDGEFSGTFITGGKEGEDVVEGKFTITQGKGGAKVSGGEMTFKVISADKFDFNGAAAGGTMARAGRSTQAKGLLLPTAPPRCRKPSPPRKPKPPPPPAAGTFVLVDSLTQITNTHPKELTIHATGETADLDHTGPNGGAGNGGDWKVHYSWQVPRTLIPGKKASITLGDTISDVNPNQPLSDSINALAPDFAQQLIVHYPASGPSSQTYAYTLAADQAGAQEITITIGFTSSSVVYHYKHA